ncbi:MAG: FAD-dependent oxidoreductase [Deltaproteobacteria bacterium]|nr:FAD-dependent oxidoreductase [Deltaproteobacteria bacterium]
MTLHNATLVATQQIAPSVRLLTFAPESQVRFTAGQWINLRIPVENQEFVTRSYSIANAPRDDGHLEFAITQVQDGPGSTALHRLSLGDIIEHSHAQGFFTLEPVERPIVMVATGTGIAPLRAMLQALTREPLEVPVRVVLGVRSQPDLLFVDELRALEEQTQGLLQFVPTLSRPEPTWTGRSGYVQTHLDAVIGSVSEDPVSTDGGVADVYICGLQRMIREARDVLKNALGFERQRIHTERFD